MHMSLRYTRLRSLALTAALVCLAMPGGIRAERAARPDPPLSAKAIVTGVVWNPDNSPYPHGKVRLRDAHSGRVEAAAVTTWRGQFTFAPVPSGAYLTEVVDDSGKVIA